VGFYELADMPLSSRIHSDDNPVRELVSLFDVRTRMGTKSAGLPGPLVSAARARRIHTITTQSVTGRLFRHSGPNCASAIKPRKRFSRCATLLCALLDGLLRSELYRCSQNSAVINYIPQACLEQFQRTRRQLAGA